MRINCIKTLFLALLLMAFSSCSNDNDNIELGYTAIQQKALSVLNGVWVSNEIKIKNDIGGIDIFMTAVPSDTLVFLSHYPAPKSFYAYDYLQGKESENFVACGTCELRTSVSSLLSCYFYVTPSGDALHLYNIESELPIKSYAFRMESATRFYAGAAYNSPIIFDKQ